MELNSQKLDSYDHVKAKIVWETIGYIWDQIAKKEGSNNAEIRNTETIPTTTTTTFSPTPLKLLGFEIHVRAQ